MQDDQPNLTPAQLEIERALRSLPASCTAIDPVSAAFVAGRRSSRSTLRLFQTATAVLLVATIAPHFIAHPLPSTAPLRSGGGGFATMAQHISPPEVSPQSLLLLDQTVLAGGLDALPRSTPPAAPPTRANNSSI